MDLVKYVAISTRGAYDKYAEVDDIVNEGVIALIRRWKPTTCKKA